MVILNAVGSPSAQRAVAEDAPAPATETPAAAVSFRSQIAPLLKQHCVACHNANTAEGGYRVDTYKELLVAGDSEAVPVSTDPEQPSELLRRLTTDDHGERMPADAEPLGAAEVQRFRDWLAAGAAFDGDDPEQTLDLVVPPPRHPDPPETYPAAVPVTAVAFSPDGSEVLSGGYHEVLVWNTEGTLQRRIANVGQRTFALAFSPDGGTLAVACGEPGRSGEVRLIDYASGEIRGVVARSTDVALCLAFRPGTDELAVGGADSLVRIVDYKTQQPVRQLAGHADWVFAVAYSDDGRQFVSGSRDKSAKVFAAQTGQLQGNYQGHAAAVRGLVISPGGKQVFSVGGDSKLHRWNLADTKRVATVAAGGDAFAAVPGEGLILVANNAGSVLQVDVASNKVVRRYQGHQDWVLAAALHPASGRVAAGGYDGQLWLWNQADGQPISHWLAKP
ncbi:c-type cytochrome domain-containing protein [Roseimaritima sediminicola]|uniref:c-type cytochrome domain-containing protein n=1 Tax=Roseimaritima sediminicola TaxID=2662066 RepID=UPI001386B2FC|nr:c-type cytochrome domain-containing protein [Roseimaritima sediminicola]